MNTEQASGDTLEHSAASTEGGSISAAASEEDLTILVVEDDAAIRETLGEILADEGYRVLTATNGAEALTCLREKERPQLILLDLMMPVMSGWEFRAEQLRDPSLARIPVLVVSGSIPSPATEALRPSAFLSKPLDVTLLLETIARYC